MAEPRLARELLKQVPIFYGLKVTEMRLFLEICSLTTIPAKQVICEWGDTSRQLYILLEGTLKVLSRHGQELAEIKPVATVGEMGLITRRPRTATVRAVTAVRLLEVGYQRFEDMLDSHPGMQTRLYRNFIKVLADRLSDQNDMLARYKRLLDEGVRLAESDEARVPDAADAAGAAAPANAPEAEDGGAEPGRSGEDAVRLFFELAKRLPSEEEMAEGLSVVESLRRDGFSAADIEYAVNWTVKHIPSARKFSLVQLSIQEALEDKWTI